MGKDPLEAAAEDVFEGDDKKAKRRRILGRKRADPDEVIVPELQERGVLIVEDDPIERERAEKATAELGYLPFAVDNLAKATRALYQSSFLFVLTDLHYPCCSGSNVAVQEQAEPQPNGLTLAVNVKMKGGKVAILTNQYHHGSVEWANNICSALKIPLLDTLPDFDTSEDDKGKKKWKEAVKRLKERPDSILKLIENE